MEDKAHGELNITQKDVTQEQFKPKPAVPDPKNEKLINTANPVSEIDTQNRINSIQKALVENNPKENREKTKENNIEGKFDMGKKEKEVISEYNGMNSLDAESFWGSLGERPVKTGEKEDVEPDFGEVEIEKTTELPNNCIEYVYKNKEKGEPAGRIVVYKPNLKYFDYPLKNFVGKSGKTFLEELTNIRLKNEKSSYKKKLLSPKEETLSMDEEMKKKNINIHLENTYLKAGVNPITGGFRRLTLMYSRFMEADNERYQPNFKFPGRMSSKRAVHEGDFNATVDLKEKYNTKIFPPLMYVELPKGKYKFYGTTRICDENSDNNPAFLVFMMPQGKRIIDWGSRGIDRKIDMGYVTAVAEKTGVTKEKIIERIVNEPFKFLAECHMAGYNLTDEWGTDSHYGNFFLSEKGEVMNVADIDDYKRKKEDQGTLDIFEKVKIKKDINILIHNKTNTGLFDVLKNLNIPKDEIRKKYIPQALNTYLQTLDNEGGAKIREIFTDAQSLRTDKADTIIFKMYKTRKLDEFKKETLGKLESFFQNYELEEKMKKKWLKYYKGQLYNLSLEEIITGHGDLQWVRADMISRMQHKIFSEKAYDNVAYPSVIKSGIKLGKSLFKKNYNS